MVGNYVVLRSIEQADKSLKRDGNLTASPKVQAVSKSKRVIEVQVLDDVEANEQRNRSDTLAIARAMPMRLIDPLPMADSGQDAGVPRQGPAWGVVAVGADKSGNLDGRGVTVAVLDTGIDLTLTNPGQAFHGVQFAPQDLMDFTEEGVQDTHGHGTHCAGTIFGRDVDRARIGIAPGVTRALIGKVIGSNGARSDILAQAIEWAVNQGADVISMSLGIDFPGAVKAWEAEGESTEAATSRALLEYRDTVRLFDKLAAFVTAKAMFRKRGLLIVAAAGNESKRQKNPPWTIGAAPPANADGILSVGAVFKNGDAYEVAPFSNTGARVAAPGVNIVSARLGGGLGTMSGTSMATPHVAGVAALWAQALGSSDLFDKVVGSARMLPNLQVSDVGNGLVHAPPP